jgi:hypothetical protein
MSEATGRAEMERRLIEASKTTPSAKGCSPTRRRPWSRNSGRSCPRRCGWWPWRRRPIPSTWSFLPFGSADVQEAGELSDRELEAVAGGWDAQSAGITCGCG